MKCEWESWLDYKEDLVPPGQHYGISILVRGNNTVCLDPYLFVL